MEGLMVAYSLINQSTPTFDINNFKGNATFINDYTNGNWVVSGDGTQAHVLGVGLNEITPTTTYFSNDASPAATVSLLQSMNASPTATDPNFGTAYPTPNTGTLDDAFLRDMFAQTRGQEPHLLADLPAGVTDLRIFRVGVGNSGTDNLVFSAGTFDPATGGSHGDGVIGLNPVIESFGSTSLVRSWEQLFSLSGGRVVGSRAELFRRARRRGSIWLVDAARRGADGKRV